MPEKIISSLAVVADYQTYTCDQCGGSVRFNGRIETTGPVQLGSLPTNRTTCENVCQGCGRVYVLDKAYPATTYRVPGAPDATVLVVFGGRTSRSPEAAPPLLPVPDNDM